MLHECPEDECAKLLAERKREQNRPVLMGRLRFDDLSFENKKTVAVQFIRRIEIDGDDVEVMWNV